MPVLAGAIARSPTGGAVTPQLTSALQAYAVDYWPPHAAAIVRMGGAGYASQLPVSTTPRALTGARAHSFFDDFYNRIHINPRTIALGNLVTAQTRQLSVWNAFVDLTHTLTAAPIANGDGMSLTAPGPYPLAFAPLQERLFELALTTSGSPVIEATITFQFTGLDGNTVTVTGQRLQAWPVLADWGGEVLESLAWLTDVQQAIDGDEDAEPKRAAPRRSFEFDTVEGRRERRFVENAVYDWAARTWVLPVWPDVSRLPAALPAASTAIALDVAYLDFRAGGLALLYTDVATFELIEIDTVSAASLALVRPTVSAWPAGTRLYPCRTARLSEAPSWRRKSDQVVIARVQFEIDEPCDWPAIAPATLYRGYPVLDAHSDESEDPTAQSARQVVVTDGDTGMVDVDDLSGLAWQRQSYAWKPYGRAERAAHRSLLYWFAGRAQRAWLPTFTDDIELLDPVGGASTTLTVANAGITRHLRGQPGRRHIRIALFDGTVHHREVLGSAELDAARESLLIDTAIAGGLTPAQVRVISWMALSRLASDRIEIAHMADSHGLARCRSGFVFAGRGEPAT